MGIGGSVDDYRQKFGYPIFTMGEKGTLDLDGCKPEGWDWGIIKPTIFADVINEWLLSVTLFFFVFACNTKTLQKPFFQNVSISTLFDLRTCKVFLPMFHHSLPMKYVTFNQQTHHISTTRILMATGVSMVVTYHEGLMSIKWHDTLITWSCRITWHTKAIISPMPHDNLQNFI